jgi:hypothetical protein
MPNCRTAELPNKPLTHSSWWSFEVSGVPSQQIEKVQTVFRQIDDISKVQLRKKLK